MSSHQILSQQAPGDVPLAQSSEITDHRIRRQRRTVFLIRWLLPFLLFAIVAFYEGYEHVLSGAQWWKDVHFTSEVLFFGVLGPSAVFIVLSYVQHLLHAQWRIQARLDLLNRDLQRKVAERTVELEKSNAELRQLDELKSEFVALVSHELRAPLTTLYGGLELALQEPDNLSPGTRKTLQVMHTECRRLMTFVRRILDVSRLDAGRLPIVLGPVALRPLLERSVDVILGDSPRVTWDVPPKIPIVLGDETHLEEAIRNVLHNAHKYAPEGTPIHVEARQVNAALHLTITDHGPGIPADLQKRIFERFYRVTNNKVVQNSSGWGLGLYLAHRLLEAQGGTLSLRSPVWPDEDAPGTTFTLKLPLDVAEELANGGDTAG